jgi:hypothetical protein
MTTDTQKPANIKDRLFYCVTESNAEAVIVAGHEDEIPNAKLVMSMTEVERIYEKMSATLSSLNQAESILISEDRQKKS